MLVFKIRLSSSPTIVAGPKLELSKAASLLSIKGFDRRIVAVFGDEVLIWDFVTDAVARWKAATELNTFVEVCVKPLVFTTS